MARLRRCLGVDIGTDKIKIADVEIDPQGIRIRKTITVPVPEVEEGEGDGKKKTAAYNNLFHTLIKEEKLGGVPAVFSISGHYFFVRKLRLPITSEDRLQRIIQYESRQQIPIPHDKTMRQYQVFENSLDKEVDVLLAAVRKDQIKDFMNLVSTSGMKPRSITITPFALFNFFIYLNQKEEEKSEKSTKKSKKPFIQFNLFKKKATRKGEVSDKATSKPEETEDTVDSENGSFAEEVKAFLNLGAKSLDLSVARIGKTQTLGFTRTVLFSGIQKDIFKALQQKLNLPTEKEAEKILWENVAALTYDYDAANGGDNINLEASEVASGVIESMVGEVRRSLDYYISQPDGMAVDSVVITGDLAKIPNILSFFEEKLALPIEVFHKPDTSRVKNPTDQDLSAFVIPMGLAIEGLGIATIDHINFLPEDLKTLQQFKSKYWLVAAMGILVLFTLFFGSQTGKKTVELYQQKSEEWNNQVFRQKDLFDLTNKAIETRQQIAQKYDILAKVLPSDRDLSLKLLRIVQAQKPPNVLINMFWLKPFGELQINGTTEADEFAVEFVENLKKNLSDFYDPDFAPGLKNPQPVFDPIWQKQVTSFTITTKIKGLQSVVQTPPPTTQQPTGGAPGLLAPRVPRGTGAPALSPAEGGRRSME